MPAVAYTALRYSLTQAASSILTMMLVINVRYITFLFVSWREQCRCWFTQVVLNSTHSVITRHSVWLVIGSTNVYFCVHVCYTRHLLYAILVFLNFLFCLAVHHVVVAVWHAGIWRICCCVVFVACFVPTGVNAAGDAGDTSPQYFAWGDVNGNIPPNIFTYFRI